MLYYINMKKIALTFLSFLLLNVLFSQPNIGIDTDIFSVRYSSQLEQPLFISYTVLCPNGDASRSGLDFRLYEGVHTSDNDDYKNNEWDKGHLAPAAAFNCDRDMLKQTFTYINCSLQHEGLNRGPWKELEEFERNLAKVYDEVYVTILCHFSENSLLLPTGATVPDGFTKTITWGGKEECFYFPNQDVSGTDWIEFRITNE
jgi:DNA/RNA endonuclease G (NUC1)